MITSKRVAVEDYQRIICSLNLLGNIPGTGKSSERESVCVCVLERERECVCVCVLKRERERVGVCVLEREIVCVCVCVCV